MYIEDGILENVHKICGPQVTANYVSKYEARILPRHIFSSDVRPNLWARFWWFILFGVKFKKNINPTIDRVENK